MRVFVIISLVVGAAACAGSGSTSSSGSASASASSSSSSGGAASSSSSSSSSTGGVTDGGGSGASCTFNTDCPTTERCECDEVNGCACRTGLRGTGRNGVDSCTDGNDCESSVCAEGNGGYVCSGPCNDAGDCGALLPICANIAFIGKICIRVPDGGM